MGYEIWEDKVKTPGLLNVMVQKKSQYLNNSRYSGHMFVEITPYTLNSTHTT
uniref:Uncharacterized protein n=1 Tax=Arion vulgaris TaxID=1028688 RepID=A0A0B7BND2_9EUPU